MLSKRKFTIIIHGKERFISWALNEIKVGAIFLKNMIERYKISPTGEIYSKEFEKLKGCETHFSPLVCFGDFFFALHGKNLERYGMTRGMKKDISYFQKKLAKLFSNPETRHLVCEFIKEGMEDPILGQKIAGKERRMLAMAITKTVPFPKIPRSLFLDMLRVHKDNFSKKQEYLDHMLGIAKKGFEIYLKQLIRKGIIPLSGHQFQREMEKITTLSGRPVDALRWQGGRYRHDLHTIEINSQYIENMHLYFHEMFHAIAGKTVLINKDPDIEEESLDTLDTQRGGLLFTLPEVTRFFWLNEAITESITNEVMKNVLRKDFEKSEEKVASYLEGSSYKKEQELLELLIEAGRPYLDEKLFYAAYFEDFEPSLPEGQRIPHWKALWKAINQAYEPGFLAKLDRYVQKNGIEAAIKTMQKDWHKI